MTEIHKRLLTAQKTWINEIMRKTGVGVLDMAKAAGVTPTSVYQWRRGYRVIPMERAITMCHELGVNPIEYMNRLISEALK